MKKDAEQCENQNLCANACLCLENFWKYPPGSKYRCSWKGHWVAMGWGQEGAFLYFLIHLPSFLCDSGQVIWLLWASVSPFGKGGSLNEKRGFSLWGWPTGQAIARGFATPTLLGGAFTGAPPSFLLQPEVKGREHLQPRQQPDVCVIFLIPWQSVVRGKMMPSFPVSLHSLHTLMPGSSCEFPLRTLENHHHSLSWDRERGSLGCCSLSLMCCLGEPSRVPRARSPVGRLQSPLLPQRVTLGMPSVCASVSSSPE